MKQNIPENWVMGSILPEQSRITLATYGKFLYVEFPRTGEFDDIEYNQQGYVAWLQSLFVDSLHYVIINICCVTLSHSLCVHSLYYFN